MGIRQGGQEDWGREVLLSRVSKGAQLCYALSLLKYGTGKWAEAD